MKIGIVTFWKSNDNYGQILQAYALYKYLQLRGHECYIIKYLEERNTTFFSRIITVFKIIISVKKLQSFIKAKRQYQNIKEIKIEDRFFDDFRKKYMRFSKEYLHSELINNPPKADAYVCGSDQIWGSLDSIMYLSFAPKNCKKIAFAPSFGGLVPDFYVKNKIKNYLKSFDLISCRELSGVDLCKSLGRSDALHFPDPTLMHNVDIYDELTIANKQKKPYIFVYLLGNDMQFNTQHIFDFANKNDLDIVFVTGQNGIFNDFEKRPATIEEWITYIKHANYVITNSFHGTVFSILFHKKFITIPLIGAHSRMNVRIYELLKKYCLEERLYKGDLDALHNNIDYSTFELLQNEEIQDVNKVLKNIL